jgi:hypothetical protein
MVNERRYLRLQLKGHETLVYIATNKYRFSVKHTTNSNGMNILYVGGYLDKNTGGWATALPTISSIDIDNV